MRPHEQRVIIERNELDKKLEALTAFTFTEAFKGLPSDERTRLNHQHDAMRLYLRALDDRIRAFSKEKPHVPWPGLPANWNSPRQMIEEAWGLIANAYWGDWEKAPEAWRDMAKRWRDNYVKLP